MLLAPARQPAAALPHAPHLDRVRVTLADGETTTVHVASYSLEQTDLRVVRLPELSQLERWCRARDVDDALVGGFYLRNAASGEHEAHGGMPLGELRIAGEAQPSVPFSAPWNERRAAVQISGAGVRIARREELGEQPDGDLLQAGPLLVRGGVLVASEEEGFSEGASQFDSDITAGRHPRAALGCAGDKLIAVACDGRADHESGLTIGELAEVLVELGAREALNLDGGGSTSLVCGGRLANIPRESHGTEVRGGREIATALVFARR
jgi:hypothetical protein